MPDYFIDTLANGVRLVSVPMPHLHAAELFCFLGVGGRCELPEQAGISHLLEHMIFRGTADYPTSLELERAFEEIGGAVNAATDMETTCFHSCLHPSYWGEGVALFASMLRRPRFAELATEKRIVLEEAREDYNEAGEQINPDNLMVALMWPGHPLGKSLVGSPGSLGAIDQGTLEDYYRSWYQPQNLVVCACGPLDRKALHQAVTSELGDWTGAALPTAVASPVVVPDGPESCWVYDSASQISLQLAFRVPGRDDERTLSLRLLRRLLAWGGGAKLTLRLREELGLTYAVDAGCTLLQDTGYLAIDLAVAPENLPRALAELLQVLAELREQPLEATEVAAVLRSYLFDLEFSRDQSEALALRYGWGLQADYLRTLEQDFRELQRLDPAAVQQVARDFFRPEGMKLVVVGPWKEQDRWAAEGLLETGALS
jgi:predicted Zn-dependent peptidase